MAGSLPEGPDLSPSRARIRHVRIAVAALALLAAACGVAARPTATSPAAPAAHREHGLVVSLPPGWSAAAESLTPNLTDPREVLAVGTGPLRYRETGCAHVPGSALEDLGPSGALVTLYERARPTGQVPARPARFGPGLGGPSEASACVPGARFTDHWFMFADQGRAFHVLVAFGPEASAETRAQAWRILDGLQVDPATISVGQPVGGELVAPPLRSSPGYRARVVRTHAPDLCIATVPVGQRPGEADRACDTGRSALFIERYGATERLSTRRHRRPGAVFGDEIGENVLTRTRAQVLERFGPPARTRGACDFYELVGDARRRGWRFCYRAGGVMTAATGWSSTA
jgi:hypothetical protein